MKSLLNTLTAKNLMVSYAGECQARTRYAYYSGIARKQGYIQISNIFMEIAEQEKEHAKKFYKFLKDSFIDEQIEINASFPVSFHDNTLLNLKASASGENEEWTDLYPEFARVAREEGFEEIATAFENISKIEKIHEQRFNKLVKNIEEGKVFKKDEVIKWKCLNCGHIHEGEDAPILCPTCVHPQGYFEVFIENY